ncbi:IS1595 family transposase ISMpo2 [Methylobacterium cerastii]|uniref:IS1595 family transposase ISMpo2 n=1 Tax=Methylobacterium cerastii TaxID=932741 RepID=A0ABQ4QDK8_9HYPH|nr:MULTISPECIES: SRPBCC family protein [Methylobacterium]TXN84101.1 SRPBCC family protein [Methylobacterium sp. WL8]GJD43298.1 IS1595 family transposase ISMpo2 [Methylobacterium cerastii]
MRPGRRVHRRPLPGLLLATAIGAAVPSEAFALEVTRSRVVAAPPAAVWSLVGGFCDIARWHPQVTRCTLSSESGAPVRALVAAGGLGTLIETETARDEAAMSYSYRLVSGPLPVKDYAATLSVAPIGGGAGKGATITWTAHFEAEGMTEAEAVADIAGVYEAGLAGIAREAAP